MCTTSMLRFGIDLSAPNLRATWQRCADGSMPTMCVCAALLEQPAEEQTDRSQPDHRNRFSLHIPQPVDSIDHRGERLDQADCAVDRSVFRGQFDGLGSLGHKKLRQPWSPSGMAITWSPGWNRSDVLSTTCPTHSWMGAPDRQRIGFVSLAAGKKGDVAAAHRNPVAAGPGSGPAPAVLRSG